MPHMCIAFGYVAYVIKYNISGKCVAFVWYPEFSPSGVEAGIM